jgi:single-stranded-DNA-specific exonuclease
LAALGMIADMVSLKDFETRRLITIGLSNIINPFIKEMVKKNNYSLGGNVTPIGVAFYIAPYVNATIRSGTLEEKNLLFESMLNHKAYEMIDSTKRGCQGQKEEHRETENFSLHS